MEEQPQLSDLQKVGRRSLTTETVQFHLLKSIWTGVYTGIGSVWKILQEHTLNIWTDAISVSPKKKKTQSHQG